MCPIFWWVWVVEHCFLNFPSCMEWSRNLINRCTSDESAQRFFDLMHAYSARAKAVHSGFRDESVARKY